MVVARSLNGNQIGDAGAAAIGEALKTNTALSVLQCAERVLVSGMGWRAG